MESVALMARVVSMRARRQEGRILGELGAMSGSHRKHALRAFRSVGRPLLRFLEPVKLVEHLVLAFDVARATQCIDSFAVLFFGSGRVAAAKVRRASAREGSLGRL